MDDETEYTNMWHAWRVFIRTCPELSTPLYEAAFMAGASSALSIAYARGFVQLRAELAEILKEETDG